MPQTLPHTALDHTVLKVTAATGTCGLTRACSTKMLAEAAEWMRARHVLEMMQLAVRHVACNRVSCPLAMLLPVLSPLPVLDLFDVGHGLIYVQEARKHQQRQSKPRSEATAAKASQGLHSKAPAPSPSSAAQTASMGSFPGFAVLPSQQVTTAAPTGTAKPSLRRAAPPSGCSTESCLLQPVLSQDPKLPCYSLASEAHSTTIITSISCSGQMNCMRMLPCCSHMHPAVYMPSNRPVSRHD